jgi:hypothetical protein
MKNGVRLAAGVLCCIVLGCVVARIAHLRSVHATPPHRICGGELIPCAAQIGATGTTGATGERSPAYDPCWELEQPAKHSPRLYEDAELAILRKLDEAHCSVLVRVRAMMPGR